MATAEQLAENRRAHPRAPALIRVRYGSAGILKTDFTENISRGGLFIATHEPFELGQRIELKLACPGLPAEVPVTGLIRWVGSRPTRPGGPPIQGIGIEFDHASDPLKTARLEALVDAAFEPLTSEDDATVTVLLVDPNAHTRSLFARGLKKQTRGDEDAIRILEAPDGLSALSLAGKQPISVVLTELGLPDLNGFDLIERLRTELAPAPAICALSHGFPGDKDRAIEAGADVFARKPVVLKGLINTVKMMLRTATSQALDLEPAGPAPQAESDPMDDLLLDDDF